MVAQVVLDESKVPSCLSTPSYILVTGLHAPDGTRAFKSALLLRDDFSPSRNGSADYYVKLKERIANAPEDLARMRLL